MLAKAMRKLIPVVVYYRSCSFQRCTLFRCSNKKLRTKQNIEQDKLYKEQNKRTKIIPPGFDERLPCRHPGVVILSIYTTFR